MPSRADRPTSDDFILRGLTLERLGKAEAAKVHGMLEDLYGELLEAASRVDPNKPPSWKHARLQVLEKQVRGLIKGTYGSILDDVTSDMAGVAGNESQWVRSLINKAAGEEIMDVALTKKDLQVLATDTMVQGAPSAEWWGQQAQSTNDAFMREIRNGVMRGESIDDMARRIRGRPTGERVSWYTKKGEHRWNVEFEGGVLQTNTRNAKALVRTSVMAVAGQARRETYLANRDVVKGIEQISTLDNRTTPICMAYDGEKWEFEDQDTADSLTKTAREAHGGRPVVEEVAPRRAPKRKKAPPTFSSWDEAQAWAEDYGTEIALGKGAENLPDEQLAEVASGWAKALMDIKAKTGWDPRDRKLWIENDRTWDGALAAGMEIHLNLGPKSNRAAWQKAFDANTLDLENQRAPLQMCRNFGEALIHELGHSSYAVGGSVRGKRRSPIAMSDSMYLWELEDTLPLNQKTPGLPTAYAPSHYASQDRSELFAENFLAWVAGTADNAGTREVARLFAEAGGKK